MIHNSRCRSFTVYRHYSMHYRFTVESSVRVRYEVCVCVRIAD